MGRKYDESSSRTVGREMLDMDTRPHRLFSLSATISALRAVSSTVISPKKHPLLYKLVQRNSRKESE